MDKKGLYVGNVGHGYWKVFADTKQAPTAGVIHNVIEKPIIKANPLMPAKLLENRD